jgi:ribosomal protein L31E
MAIEKLEREYNVPLRKYFVETQRHRRAKRAVSTLKKFIEKHMKCADIKLGMNLNQHIWKNGIKNPPHHVKVNCLRETDGDVSTCYVELVGYDVNKVKVEKKEKGDKGALESKVDELKKSLGGDEKKAAKKETTKKATPKKEESSPEKEVVKEDTKKADEAKAE